MNQIKLLQLIDKALNFQQNQIRQLAQKQLLQLRINNPDQFMLNCSNILANTKQSIFNRQSVSTLLIGSIRQKINKPQLVYFWDSLLPQTRKIVKNDSLSVLIDPLPVIVKSGANVISYIAMIQIPRNQWLQIVDILAQNTNHQDLNIRKASIITIGNICQVFHSAAVTIDHHSCQQFLGGIIIGTQQTQDSKIVQVSLQALRNSLTFMQPILKQQAYRNQVFRVLCSKMNNKNENQQRYVYQALFQFTKVCYQYFNPYLQFMLKIVIDHIQQRNDKTILALELLDTIGTEYLQKIQDQQQRANNNNKIIQNYLTPHQSGILPQVMVCLLIQNQKDLNFPQMRNSSFKTLSTLAAIGNRQTIDIVANGATTCLKSDKLGHQQATAILLSALCQGNDKQYIYKILNENIQNLFTLLNSQNQIVVLNTLNGLVTIAQFYPHIFCNHSNLRNIIDKFFNFLNSNNSQIIVAVLTIFKNITEIQTNNLLSDPNILLTKIVSYYQQYITNFQDDNKDFADRSIVIIMNCIVKIKNREVIHQMLQFLMVKYYTFYQQPHLSDRLIRLTSIISIIHTCVLALENTIPKQGLVNNLCKLIDAHISLFGVQQQGLNMISSMAIAFNRAFQTKSHGYWKQILNGFGLMQQPKVFKVALCCAGDFSRVYGQSYAQQQKQILGKLLHLIHQSFDRDVKICILACIADMLLGLGSAAQPQVPQILQMVDFCFRAVYQFSNNANQKQYVDQLKRGLVDMYSCLSFSINGKSQNPRNENLFNHFPVLATFVIRTCSAQNHPTIQYLKTCLYLIFDSAAFYYKCTSDKYKNTVKQIVQCQKIKELVHIIQRYKQRQDIRQLLNFVDQRYSGYANQ